MVKGAAVLFRWWGLMRASVLRTPTREEATAAADSLRARRSCRRVSARFRPGLSESRAARRVRLLSGDLAAARSLRREVDRLALDRAIWFSCDVFKFGSEISRKRPELAVMPKGPGHERHLIHRIHELVERQVIRTCADPGSEAHHCEFFLSVGGRLCPFFDGVRGEICQSSFRLRRDSEILDERATKFPTILNTRVTPSCTCRMEPRAIPEKKAVIVRTTSSVAVLTDCHVSMPSILLANALQESPQMRLVEKATSGQILIPISERNPCRVFVAPGFEN